MSITSSSAKSAVSSEGDDTALRIVVPKRSRSHYHSRSQSQGFVSTPSRTIGHRRSHSQLIPKRSAEHHSGDDVSISSKRMPLTLRDVSRRKNQTGSNAGNNATPTTQRSTSLIRNKGDKITLMGKKFHVVEVNPEFGTSKQSKSLEDGSKEESLRTFSSADEGLAVETENLVEADRVSNFKRQDKSLENGESTETAQELPDIEKTENLLVATEPAKEVTNAAKEATELDVVDESFETPTSVVAAADLEAPFEVSTEKSDSVTERVDGPVQAIATENVNLDHLDVDSVIKPINPAQLVDLDNSNPKQLVENGKSLAHVLSTISLDGKPIDDNLTSEPKPTKDTTDATDLSHSEVDKVKNPPEVSAEPALVKPVIN